MGFGFAGAAAGAAGALRQQQQDELTKALALRKLALEQQQMGLEAAAGARAQQQFDYTKQRNETADREAENQRGMRRMIGDLVMQSGGNLTPAQRQTVLGMGVTEGINIPNALAEDPNKKLTDQKALAAFQNELATKLMHERAEEERRTNAAKPPSSGGSGLVIVQTPDGPAVGDKRTRTVTPFQMMRSDGTVGPVPPTMNFQERQFNGTLGGINDMIGHLRQTFSPDYVGPLASRWHELKQATPGVQDDPGFSDFASTLQGIENALIYLKSGKQINEQEFKRILKEVPALTDKGSTDVDNSTFHRKLANTERVIATIAAEQRQRAATPGTAPSAPAVAPAAPAAGRKVGRFEVLEH